MLVTSLDVRRNLWGKLVITIVTLAWTVPMGVLHVVFPCVLWLSYLCGLLLWKLCMSYCIMCLWQCLDFIPSNLRLTPTFSLGSERTLTQVTLILTSHTQLVVRRQSRPLSCADKQEIRHILKINGNRAIIPDGTPTPVVWGLVGISY